MVQKLYGREPESLNAVTQIFHRLLGKFDSDKVLKAFETYITRENEFPTPADIVTTIKRNGKPPFTESRYIAICRKPGEDRSDEEWQYKKDYEIDQATGWEEEPDGRKLDELTDENIRLRKELFETQKDRDLAWEHVNSLKRQKDIMPPPDSEQAKIERTIHVMRAGGSPEEDIEAFKKSMGVSA